MNNCEERNCTYPIVRYCRIDTVQCASFGHQINSMVNPWVGISTKDPRQLTIKTINTRRTQS